MGSPISNRLTSGSNYKLGLIMGMTQEIEYLPSNHKALEFKIQIKKERKKKK
jgi:hypothetical protein